MSRITGTAGLLVNPCPDGVDAVVVDHPSEHVQSWKVGWLWPWQRRVVARSLVEEEVRPGQCWQLVFRLERDGWRVTLVTLDETALARFGDAGVWRFSHLLGYYDRSWRWRKSVMRVVEVASGWRFAAYVGGHLIYSRHLDRQRCPDRSSARQEAQALSAALADRGVVSVAETQFPDGESVAGWCRHYLARRWHWRGAIRRPGPWPPPQQWFRRLMALWFWTLSLGAANAALEHWGVPGPDDSGPQVIPPTGVMKARERLEGQAKLAGHTKAGQQQWLNQLMDAQSQAGSEVSLETLSWQREEGRQVMMWQGRAEDESIWREYRRRLPHEGFKTIWPGAAVDLDWQRLNPPVVKRLDDPVRPEPVEWQATLEVRR
ncbi:MAG: hypothetical protein ACQES2_12060 [Pseudomonadota bacterium]